MLAQYEEKSRQVDRVMTLLDMCLSAIAYMISFWLPKTIMTSSDAGFLTHLSLLPLILFMLIFFLPRFGAYESPRTTSILGYGRAVAEGVFFSIVTLLAILLLMDMQRVSRTVIVMFAAMDILILLGFRTIVVLHFRKSIQNGENFLKVLIIGTGKRAMRLSRKLRESVEWGVDIVGHLDSDPTRVGPSVLGFPVLGTVADISAVLKRHVVDEVILAIPRAMIDDVDAIAYACEEEGVRCRFMADMFDLQLARMSLVQLDDIPLLTLEPVAQDELKLIVKRVLDLTFTLISMPVILPLMGIIALAIKFESPGPALFVQDRVGLKKRIFPMFKVRSMHQGADERLKDLEDQNEAEGPIFKIANDPRVTKIGRVLRRTSLDELPQLFNVLGGQMSLVGPRPMSIRDVDLFDMGIQRKRFSVKPGLTCLWQVSGRSNLPFSKWLELDLAYIENWSLFLDFKILLRTFSAVVKGTGAA